ncbi:hypothetical protein J7K18_07090 [bacterium]|nr:hypothetical protein [bacterium]
MKGLIILLFILSLLFISCSSMFSSPPDSVRFCIVVKELPDTITYARSGVHLGDVEYAWSILLDADGKQMTGMRNAKKGFDAQPMLWVVARDTIERNKKLALHDRRAKRTHLPYFDRENMRFEREVTDTLSGGAGLLRWRCRYKIHRACILCDLR